MQSGVTTATGLGTEVLEAIAMGAPPSSVSSATTTASAMVSAPPASASVAHSGRIDDGDALVLVRGVDERTAVEHIVSPPRPLLRAFTTRFSFVVADAVALALCGAIGYVALRFWNSATAAWAAPRLVVALSPFIIAYILSGLYTGIRLQPVVELRRITQANLIVVIAMWAAAAAVLTSASSSALDLATCLCFMIVAMMAQAFVPLMRAIVRRIGAPRSWWGFPTLVISSGNTASILAHSLRRNPQSGLHPAAITDPTFVCRSAFVPVVNDPAAVELMIKARGIRHAIVSLPDATSLQLAETVERFRGLIPHLLVIGECSRLPRLWGLTSGCDRIHGLELRNRIPLFGPRATKRALDLFVAGTVLLLGLPIFLAVAAVIKLTSKGPVFYKHTRLGRDGRDIAVWKFRSMKPNGNKILEAHFAKHPEAKREWELTFKLQDDPRVTWIGKVLRSTSLDELPQVFNVISGEMSVVGPRPIINDEVVRYADRFRFYTEVKPGITGLWQISGRNDTSYDERVRLDEFYVKNWSPWLDIYILARTVVTLVRRTGAY